MDFILNYTLKNQLLCVFQVLFLFWLSLHFSLCISGALAVVDFKLFPFLCQKWDVDSRACIVIEADDVQSRPAEFPVAGKPCPSSTIAGHCIAIWDTSHS